MVTGCIQSIKNPIVESETKLSCQLTQIQEILVKAFVPFHLKCYRC